MRAASDILTNYQHIIGELKLVTGGAGIFDVTVNGDLIYSKGQTGRHANEGEVLDLFTAHVGDSVRRFGT